MVLKDSKLMFVLLLLLVLVTGCDVKYTLKYKDGVFKEQINISSAYDNEEITSLPTITDLKNDGQYADYLETLKYNQTIKDKGNNMYDIIFKAKYDNVSYSDANVLHECFRLFDFKETTDYYYISAYDDFYCDYADSLLFNLESDHVVTFNNASKTNNGIYTWDLSKDQVRKEGIRFQISKNRLVTNKNTSKPKLIIELIVLIAVVILFIIYKRSKKKQ